MIDDRQMVAAVLADEPGAFVRLVQAYQRLVWHLLQRMIDNPHDVDELSQDVFLQVHRRLGQFRFEASLGAWIGRIAFSRASRHLRRRRIPLEDGSDDDAAAEAVPDPSRPDDIVHEASRRRDLERALQDLAPLQRTIVALYHLEECGIAEVARITDLPEGTVKSHLFRARRQLRRSLQPLLGETTNA